jgi:diacylglycerol kinase (ATP)
MRVAAILGPGASPRQLRPFQQASDATWFKGLPGISRDADAILIFGGDGTIHRHLAQLVNLRLPVLVSPCGSGNDFAHALGLGSARDSLAAWRRFTSQKDNVRALDLGVISPVTEALDAPSHFFCGISGVGLDAEVARRANRMPRWLRANGGYLLSLLPALFQFAPLPIKILTAQSGQPETWIIRSATPTILAALANVPAYGGGMKIAPQAQFDDGELDVCVIREIDKFKLFCLFPTVYFGRHLSVKEVAYFRAEHIRLETETPLDVYADGEYVCHTPIEVSVARKALQIIVHPALRPF